MKNVFKGHGKAVKAEKKFKIVKTGATFDTGAKPQKGKK